jgi:hypothetical protein
VQLNTFLWQMWMAESRAKMVTLNHLWTCLGFFSQVISFSFFFFPAYMVSSEEITLTTPLVPLIDARDSQSN